MELTSLGILESNVRERLTRELIDPAVEFLSRSSKGVRRQLVVAGSLWVQRRDLNEMELKQCDELGLALELIHSASLIIDDIQDDSPMRRGREAVHVVIGTAKAINLANWIYFKGFEQVDRLSVSEHQRLALLRLFRQALLKGHAGQALDLGTPIRSAPREQVAALCRASVRLKTGALTGLAYAGGSVLGGATDTQMTEAYGIGEDIGVILQALDDLKNLKADPLAVGKQFEDLRNDRPGFVWFLAATHANPECWSELVASVERLPDAGPFAQWQSRFEIPIAARTWLERQCATVRERTGSQIEIENILAQLVRTYENL